MKPKCRWCNKTRKPIKYYVIADDLENPKPYHKICLNKMYFKAMLEIDKKNEKY